MTLTVQAALAMGNKILSAACIEGAPRETRLMMAAVLDIPRDRISLHANDPLDAMQEAVFFADVQERTHRVPLSHILGHRSFYGRDFAVTADVLDPRPETETLVAASLAESFAEVLDLGIGSGAILLSLLAERPDAIGIGADVSQAALAIAERNADRFGVLDRVDFVQSDWFQAVGGQFDLIVSNPPYIAAGEMDDLQPEVRLHEPRIALTDEADGLTHYRKIIAGHDAHLRPGGRLMVEIGPTQAEAVSAMMADANLTEITVIPDLDGRDRVVWGRKPLKTA